MRRRLEQGLSASAMITWLPAVEGQDEQEARGLARFAGLTGSGTILLGLCGRLCGSSGGTRQMCLDVVSRLAGTPTLGSQQNQQSTPYNECRFVLLRKKGRATKFNLPSASQCTYRYAGPQPSTQRLHVHNRYCTAMLLDSEAGALRTTAPCTTVATLHHFPEATWKSTQYEFVGPECTVPSVRLQRCH